MGVCEGNLQVIDVNMILDKNCPVTIVRNLLVYSVKQQSTIVIIVYDDKCHRTIPQYVMDYSVVQKNIMMATMLHFRFTPPGLYTVVVVVVYVLDL